MTTVSLKRKREGSGRRVQRVIEIGIQRKKKQGEEGGCANMGILEKDDQASRPYLL